MRGIGYKFQTLESVTNFHMFPLGYKFRYRDYCSDRVVELKLVNMMEAQTTIGRTTGIEPVTNHVKWFPEENNDLLGIIIYLKENSRHRPYDWHITR